MSGARLGPRLRLSETGISQITRVIGTELSTINFIEHCSIREREWEHAEVLFIFLKPMIVRFESHCTFFTYDPMFNDVEDVFCSLHTAVALGILECASVFKEALVKIKPELEEYYDKSKIPFSTPML